MRIQLPISSKPPPHEWSFAPLKDDHRFTVATIKGRPPDSYKAARRNSYETPVSPTRRIVVPTDFSPASSRAIDHAVAIATQSGAALTILHVIDLNPPAACAHYGTADDLMRQLWVTAAAELARLTKSIEEHQVRTQKLLVEGLPWEAIVDNSYGFDLLIISEPQPKRGWNFFSKHTAGRVIEQAKCPVHVVRPRHGFGS